MPAGEILKSYIAALAQGMSSTTRQANAQRLSVDRGPQNWASSLGLDAADTAAEGSIEATPALWLPVPGTKKRQPGSLLEPSGWRYREPFLSKGYALLV